MKSASEVEAAQRLGSKFRTSMDLAMTSSQSIAVASIFGLGPSRLTPPVTSARRSRTRRTALYSMINAKDVSTQDALNAKMRKASTKLDSVLAGMTGSDAKAAADFKAPWDQFKGTRDNQIAHGLRGNISDAFELNARLLIW